MAIDILTLSMLHSMKATKQRQTIVQRLLHPVTPSTSPTPGPNPFIVGLDDDCGSSSNFEEEGGSASKGA